MTYYQDKKSNRSALALAAVAIIGVGVLTAYLVAPAVADEAAQGAAQAPPVEVIAASSAPIRIWSNFSGRLEAVEHVQVRPRVSGTITKILFEEGAVVEEGAPLFIIDPRPYEADLASAKAAIDSANSQLRLAQLERDRARKLVKSSHISQSTLDTRESDYRVAVAALNAAKAREKNAALNLEYAHVNAPVAGRVSRAEITVGNVIEAGSQAPVLTTIVSNDKLYAEFDVDEQTYLRTARGSRNEKMPVELTLAGDDSVVYKGHIHSFDNQLNTSTGTIRARAIFSNKDGVLIPGMYANIRMGAASKESIMLVPERAIGTDQSKKYVYVVDDAGTVSYREIVLGRQVGSKRIINSGIKEGELIMVNSLQRVRPGMQVTPIDITKKEDQSTNKSGVKLSEK